MNPRRRARQHRDPPARRRPARGRRPDDRRGLRGSSRRCSSSGSPAVSWPRARSRASPRRPADSTAVRTLTAILPPPTRDRRRARRMARRRPACPTCSSASNRCPRPPVDRPADPAAQAIVAAVAEASTLKVSAATCGLSLGRDRVRRRLRLRGHQCARRRRGGLGGVRVNARTRTLLDAVPVLFDPDLDVAVLHVDRPRRSRRSPSPGRTRARRDRGRARLPGRRRAQDRAGGGLGPFPGDRPRHLRRLEGPARGARAARQIDRGDSGGPFILTDGSVGGVVFAEAKTNEDVGYALSAREVAARVAPGSGAPPRSTPATACGLAAG